MAGKQWTGEEDRIIRDLYGTMPAHQLVNELPQRTCSAILCRAQRLRIAKLGSPPWTKIELELLEQIYPSSSVKDIKAAFPARKWRTIVGAANAKLCLRRKKKHTRLDEWSEEEIALLQKVYPSAQSTKSIAHHFPKRTRRAISFKTSQLGLRCTRFTLSSESFEAHLMPIPESGCLVWEGYWNESGYGITSRGSTHRLAWKIYKGPIPKGLHVLHKLICSVPACCRIDHLYLGTPLDNVKDREERSKQYKLVFHARGETHGHSSLTTNEVKAIRESSDGVSLIASRYGISRNHVWEIRTRRSWKHVP